ncbi:nitroreductase family deazaflavin-dependent oxidoreductase [Allokutzneria albata]|uniref:Deazaflavin-dependent oxidoreductase, nitroreductase family n=1 Tax=Allokutzneria albata TaxID=211114 RepID=A0A1G9VCQ4_ALLAB|nr:nitroreductase family deazaflavin-dependent oxidoreductase [Allokutzneria albata]SDM69846.1 deazaflavin-dependent oxidoreductase, nitroreductase family [Allokutzneria albata]
MNPITAVARRLGRQKWFSDLGRAFVPVDLAVQRRTKGKISLLALLGLPSMLLTTTGRKSGQPRSVPLLYVPHPRGFIVTASNWGGPKHPAWSANLIADPDAEAVVRAKTIAVRAELAEGELREELWQRITEHWPAYDTYAERAGSRRIRVFLLTVRR